jgi:hypothetical protein
MKVRVIVNSPQVQVDEVFTGDNAEAVVSAMQKAVAARLPFLMRPFVNAMSPVQFSQEVVRRYNDSARKSLPPPQSCEEFLQMGEKEGTAVILEP